MAERQVRARVAPDVSTKIDSIVSEINDRVPEASVNVSSILRYAIEEYVKRYDAKNDGTAVFLELSTVLPNEDLETVAKNLMEIKKVYQNANHPLPDAFKNELKVMHEAINHLLRKSETPNNDRVAYGERLNEILKEADGKEE